MSNQKSTDHIDVKYVAHLARMDLDEAEVAGLQGQLDRILEYVKRIREPDVTGIEPTSHAIPHSNVFRTDQSRPGLERSVVLENAPKTTGDLFAVPRILE